MKTVHDMACLKMAQMNDGVTLAPPERQELERRARSRSLGAESVRRAKVILMLAAGRLPLITLAVCRSALRKSD